jgi:hypothetical protein
MKSKFFILVVLFLGFGLITFAQAQTSAPAEKKDAPAQTIKADESKTAECPHHATMEKSDCKWVDANNDGICDTCKKTEKECKESCKAASSDKKCDPAACTGKEGEKSAGCCSSKGGKKVE